MTSVIIFIGGQSQSSKSTLGRQLATKIGYTYKQLNYCTPKGASLSLGQYSAKGMKFERLQNLASDIVCECRENTVIEGGWIIPEALEALSAKIEAKGNVLIPAFFRLPKFNRSNSNGIF